MEPMEIVSLLSRWLHIVPAIVLVGGLMFLRFALVPAAQSSDGVGVDDLREATRAKWSKLVMISIGLLLLSGLYNTAYKAMNFDLKGSPYNILLGVKLLLAFVVFFLASLLSGRSDNAKRFREKESMWLNVTLLLAVVLICIAGFMKSIDVQPKTTGADGPTGSSSSSSDEV